MSEPPQVADILIPNLALRKDTARDRATQCGRFSCGCTGVSLDQRASS